MKKTAAYKLEQAYYELTRMERTAAGRCNAWHDMRALIITTFVFLICMLSLPLTDLGDLILYFIFPLWCCMRGDLSFRFLFIRSLMVLPFILLIGIFNPLFDHRTAFRVGDYVISVGWVTFTAILLRGLLSVQAALALILLTGFYNFCRGLEQLRVPSFFTTQLLFVYRYIFVLIEEALSMIRARDSRSFGNRGYSLRMWGTLTGQLLIRTFERASRIQQAMVSRGFTGEIQGRTGCVWQSADTWFTLSWSLFFILIRIIRPMQHLHYVLP